jgi:hypothetical protein
MGQRENPQSDRYNTSTRIRSRGQGSKGCASRLRQCLLPPTDKDYYSFFWREYMTNQKKDKDGRHESSVAVEVFVWDIPGHFLSALALMILSPGLYATVLLAGCVESGSTCTMCVWVITAYPLIYNPGLRQTEIRAEYVRFYWFSACRVRKLLEAGRAQGIGLRCCDAVFLGGK